jgi:ferric-dicitrate binding protein FerR (iron transport regulator)
MTNPAEITKDKLLLIERWAALTVAYRSGTLSPEEQTEWNNLTKNAEFNTWLATLTDENLTSELVNKYARCQNNVGSAIAEFHQQANKTSNRSFLRTTWFRYAAAIMLLAGAGLLYILNQTNQPPKQPATAATEIMPGGNKATLTLADGTVIILDSANNSTLANQGSIQVVKLADGQLAYRAINGATTKESSAPMFNTISTPKGGQYQVILPDGSTLWLNAASTIRFPAVFNGSERNVELQGEGYFEVKKNSSMPFVVKTKAMSVQVLGTDFNVMAYDDEKNSRTTLVTGSVKVIRDDEKNILKPGQQANVSGGSTEIINNANIEEALAWKNGKFYFEGADIKSIMRQIARWYDVEVEFEGNVTKEKFEGEISRNSPLSEVLKILELTSVHFRMENKKLIVLP